MITIPNPRARQVSKRKKNSRKNPAPGHSSFRFDIPPLENTEKARSDRS